MIGETELKFSDLRLHLNFWRDEYSRRSAHRVARNLPTKVNEIVVRALEIVGQPHELDLNSPDPSRSKFLMRTQLASLPVTLEIPSQGDVLGVDGHWWPPVRVHQLKGVLFDTASGLAFANDRVVSQSGMGHRWSRDAAFITGALRRVEKDGVIRINSKAAPLGQTNNYYHLMIETIPRLLQINVLNPHVVFYTDTKIPDFALKILQFVGLDQQISVLPGVIEADELWLCEPSPLFFPHPDNLRLLSKELGSRVVEVDEPRKVASSLIYISRSKSSRSLQNESQLEEHLSKLGFSILHLEDLSVAEQISRVRAAKVLVAPHGAGLSNIPFLQEGARIIELSSGEWWWPCFRRMAFGLGLDYQLVLLPASKAAPNGRAVDAIPLVDAALAQG